MNIQVDTREKAHAIESIEAEFRRQGVRFFTSKLFVGDYASLDNPRLCIDRKMNLAELCRNVSTVPKKDKTGHIKKGGDGKPLTELSRFTDELQRAHEHGIKMIILCEHGGSIKTLEDVKGWVNPRLKESPLAMSGPRLYQILLTLSITYEFDVLFCDKRNTGKEIIRILSEPKGERSEQLNRIR